MRSTLSRLACIAVLAFAAPARGGELDDVYNLLVSMSEEETPEFPDCATIRLTELMTENACT